MGRKPQKFWKAEENRLSFFDTLFVKLGYKYMDDWYKVTQEDIYKNGGMGLLNNYYAWSPSRALLSVYPEHEWDLKKFNNKPLHLFKRGGEKR